MKTVTFMSKNEQGLIVKYGNNNPRKAIKFIGGFYRTSKKEEIDAINKLINRRAVPGLFVAKMYDDTSNTKEEPKKEEKKKGIKLKKK